MKIKNQGIERYNYGHEYAMISGELTNVEIIGFNINTDTDNLSVEYSVKLPNGNETILKGKDAVFYHTPKDFEAGKSVGDKYDDNISRILDRVFEMPCRIEDDTVIPYCWVFEDGEPKKVEPLITQIVVRSNSDNKLKGQGIPEEYYKSREEVLKWHDYIVREKDGSTHAHKAVLPRILLTDEQRKAVEAVADAYKKAREMGVRFIYDAEEDVHRAINVLNAEDVQNTDEYSFNQNLKDGHTEGEYKELYGDLCIRKTRIDISFYDYWLNCDFGLYIKMKEE